MGLEQLVEALPPVWLAGAVLIEQGSPLPWIGNGDGGGKQVELVHRKRPPITQPGEPHSRGR
jgi:hypothetical protein